MITKSATSRALRGVAVLVVLGAALSGCSDDKPDPAPGTTATSAPSDPAQTSAAAAIGIDQFLALADEEPPATTKADLGQSGTSYELAVLEVSATPTSTYLRWRIRATGGSTDAPPPQKFWRGDVAGRQSAVAVVDPAGNLRVRPYRWTAGADAPASCACTILYPGDFGADGQEFTALFPPISAGATEVEVEVPPFGAVTVPVSRS